MPDSAVNPIQTHKYLSHCNKNICTNNIRHDYGNFGVRMTQGNDRPVRMLGCIEVRLHFGLMVCLKSNSGRR